MVAIGELKTVLVGMPNTTERGLSGDIQILKDCAQENRDNINRNRNEIKTIRESCARNHSGPVTIEDGDNFVIRLTKRKLAWWLTLIVMILAGIITFLISGTDYFNLLNRAVS